MGKLKSLVLGVAGLSLLALPVSAQYQQHGPDQELVTKLHQLGQDQIAVAKLAEERAVRPDVKALARTVQREQRIANNLLVAYAASKTMNVTIAEPGGAQEHGAIANAPLVNSPRAAFDHKYVDRVVFDQQAAMDAAAAAQRLARDPALKGVIGGVMVVQADNLVSAQQLLAQLPEPPPPETVPLPAYPGTASRTQTGADNPPPGAWKPILP